MTRCGSRVLLIALLALTISIPRNARGQADGTSASPAAALGSPLGAQASEARAHVARGESLFDAQNYEGALAEFERAYLLLAGHPVRAELLYNLALCRERLGHYAEALENYGAYLRDAGPDAPDRPAVQASMRTLEGLLGTLLLHIRFEKNGTPSALEVWIDERLAGHGPGDYLLPSGRHTIEVRAPGYEPALHEVSLTARAKSQLSVELALRSRGLKPALFWTGVGLTAGGAIASGVLGARALSKSSDVKDKPVLARTDADRRQVRKAAIAADVTMGATSALAIGTVILLFLTDFDQRHRESPPRQSISWLPAADVGLSWSCTLP